MDSVPAWQLIIASAGVGALASALMTEGLRLFAARIERKHDRRQLLMQRRREAYHAFLLALYNMEGLALQIGIEVASDPRRDMLIRMRIGEVLAGLRADLDLWASQAVRAAAGVVIATIAADPNQPFDEALVAAGPSAQDLTRLMREEIAQE